jgi:hypothetical protein
MSRTALSVAARSMMLQPSSRLSLTSTWVGAWGVGVGVGVGVGGRWCQLVGRRAWGCGWAGRSAKFAA